MWTVISEMGPDGPEYIVVNKVTGERKGKFGCEPWAQEFADELNREEKNAKDNNVYSGDNNL